MKSWWALLKVINELVDLLYGCSSADDWATQARAVALKAEVGEASFNYKTWACSVGGPEPWEDNASPLTSRINTGVTFFRSTIGGIAMARRWIMSLVVRWKHWTLPNHCHITIFLTETGLTWLTWLTLKLPKKNYVDINPTTLILAVFRWRFSSTFYCLTILCPVFPFFYITFKIKCLLLKKNQGCDDQTSFNAGTKANARNPVVDADHTVVRLVLRGHLFGSSVWEHAHLAFIFPALSVRNTWIWHGFNSPCSQKPVKGGEGRVYWSEINDKRCALG